MALRICAIDVPVPSDRVFRHLLDQFSNHARYFSIHEEPPARLLLGPREWNGVSPPPVLTTPRYRVDLRPSGSGTRVILWRELAPARGWFFGLFASLSGLFAFGMLVAWGLDPAAFPKLAPGLGTAVVLTLAWLAFRWMDYFADRTRDPELRGIFEKALANMDRSPT